MTRIDKEIRLLKWIVVIALAVIVAVLHSLVVTAIASPDSDSVMVLLGDFLFRFN